MGCVCFRSDFDLFFLRACVFFVNGGSRFFIFYAYKKTKNLTQKPKPPCLYKLYERILQSTSRDHPTPNQDHLCSDSGGSALFEYSDQIRIYTLVYCDTSQSLTKFF
jgi:hypothetical protein